MPALRSYNKVILVGNLTRDPELRYTPNNTPVAIFTVATNRVWVNAKGERKEEASFHRVNVWGKAGETLVKILRKGMKVLVEGILVYREVRDEQGKLVRRDARIRAESVIILERKAKGGEVRVGEEPSAGTEAAAEEPEGVSIDEIAEELKGSESEENQAEEKPKAEGENNGDKEPQDDELPF